jgi:hypothetical protein
MSPDCAVILDDEESTWFIASTLEGEIKLAAGFENKDDAQRALCWMAGAYLPQDWEVVAADSTGFALEMRIPGSRSAMIFTEECQLVFPRQDFYEAKPASLHSVN